LEIADFSENVSVVLTFIFKTWNCKW